MNKNLKIVLYSLCYLAGITMSAISAHQIFIYKKYVFIWLFVITIIICIYGLVVIETSKKQTK